MMLAQTGTNNAAARFLLSKLIDYAGLFPPASLPMSEAVRNYAAYRESDHAWMLGRFIVPVSRLAEWESLFRGLEPGGTREPWRLGVLAGNDLAADTATVADFNGRLRGFALIDAIEVKPAVPEQIQSLSEDLPRGFEIFFEIPIGSNLQAFIGAIKAVGAHAKFRTGGTTADLFPSAAGLAGSMRDCRTEMVSFKLTAGLHHALRGTYKLTYEEGSSSARMHGFLNAFLAAAFLFAGLEMAEIVGLLEEADARAFDFDDSGVRWRGRRISSEEVRSARQHLASSFGSCSFGEPVQELKNLNLI